MRGVLARRPYYHGEEDVGTHWTGDWMGDAARLDAVEVRSND
jgi:hypothetical protein